MSSGASQLIDDTNTHVQYRAGWIWDQGVLEVDGTRHGAQKAGLQASLSFTGTGIRVIGTLGASNVYGQPTTTYYSIDGEVAGTYHAPLTPSGETHYNTTFFSTQNLSPGDHTITIVNMDGTSPNTFWLDYFLIDSGPPVVTTNPDTSTTATSPTSTISVQQTSTSVTTSPEMSTTPAPLATVQTTATMTAVPPPSTSESRVSSISTRQTTSVSASHVTSTNGSTGVTILTASASISTATVEAVHTSTAEISNTSNLSDPPRPSSVNTGVIAGAAVAGGVVLAILATLFICLRRRRSRPDVFQGIVSPYMSSRDLFLSLAPSVISSPNPHPPSMRSSTTPSTALSTRAPGPASRSSRRSGVTPPYEAPPEPFVDSQSESSTSLVSTVTASPLLVPRRRTTSPPTPPKAPPMPPTALPPGMWHAPSESHGRAYSLLRSLFSQGQRANIPMAADSGLRLYADVVLPPPYTQD